MASADNGNQEITEQDTAVEQPSQHAGESSATEEGRRNTNVSNAAHLQSHAAVDLLPHLNAVFLRPQERVGGDEATVASTNSSANSYDGGRGSGDNNTSTVGADAEGGETTQDVWSMTPDELVGSLENWYGRRRTLIGPEAAFVILAVILLLLFIPFFTIVGE